ncbi:hypothetical protein JK386_12420 [Nocardioides sp. zg-536]|uniref:Uncharacterized protein n=1 Tax=Nocardioides faecalis TaxID=2803858 RepID=A0A938YA97_9ACTN|nr:hypothetical protein [Nocardioides faecalis]MBM9460710.1 hypothetical protein [Nocardioides faecalis]MBS4752649.1 hypothetical protein [Nocardioides faecalis]QVI57914.1 hypothetical protein KG111_12795 [Nocardioides faecalis]
MGWEDDLFALFDDLEDQASALHAAERSAELADRSRAEYQQVTLASRLMATVGSSATLGVAGVGRLTGLVERVTQSWLLLGSGERDWVVNLDAVGTVEGASVRAVPEVAWSPLTRLGLGSALRRIAEAGEPCVLHLRDGSSHTGSLRRVGGDFCELVEGEERRTVLVAFSALAAAQSRT